MKLWSIFFRIYGKTRTKEDMKATEKNLRMIARFIPIIICTDPAPVPVPIRRNRK